MRRTLDCVVVGYKSTPFRQLVDTTRAGRRISGSYEHFMASSVVLGGERKNYSELINACSAHSTGKPSDHEVFRLPSLGVHYLTSYLRTRGFQAEPINFFNHDRKRFDELLAEQPRSVAITTAFYFDPRSIRELVDHVRARSPETKVIVGGPYIYNLTCECPPAEQMKQLEQMGADIYVADSQGERTLGQLCAELRKPTPDLASIPNLIFGSGKSYERTRREVEENDLDQCAVDWTSFDPATLAPTVITRTARSCANRCSFCRYPILGGPHTLASLDVVERELDYLHSIGITTLVIIDDTINIPLPRFKDLCRLMIRKRYGFRWFSYFRCANADDEAFDLMAASGCAGVFLGIESGDMTILRNMNKKATTDAYRNGIAQLKSRGIITYTSFMVGFPGETEESAANTRAFIEEIRPDFYCLEAYFHERKVPIADRQEEFGMKGYGYSWTHDTMDWRRAAALVREGYKTIRNSTILPLYHFNLWSVAYYTSQGFPLEQVTPSCSSRARC